MPLTLVLGPANSAKAGEVLGAFADAASQEALLVVPTALDAEHYSRELAQEGCVLRSIVTFTGLVAEMARRAGYQARVLTALQRERVLRRAIAACRLQALNEVAGTAGFLAAAVNLVAELERSMVTPPRFGAALRSWAEVDPRRTAYAHDVGAIYLGYAAELERLGCVDPELFAWRALDALRLAPGRWGGGPVFFYGFDDLHELERDAVETLARVVGAEVTVSLTFEPGRPALDARAELVAELGALAGRRIELPPLDDFYASQSRQALHHLERTLFEPAGGAQQRVDPGAAIRLLEAGGELAEAELVAAEIRELLDRGTAPGDIAVIFRRLVPTSIEALRRTLAQYEVPLSVALPVAFSHTPLGRAVLALARCALGAGSAQELLRYLRAPGLLRRAEVADELELKIRQDALRTVAEAREALGWSLDELDAVRDARDPLGQLVRQARRLIGLVAGGQGRVLAGEEQLDAQALATLFGCAEQLRMLGEAPRGSELLELLERLELRPRPASAPRAVLVSDPLAVRARRFACVFVCGLQEGAFPRSAAPDPFLPDELRRELAAVSGLRLRLQEDAIERERYLFYASVSRATHQVVLSYRSSDEEGNIAAPSPFIEDVADVLDPGWRERRRRRLLADVTWGVEEAPTERERARATVNEAAEPGDAAPGRRLGARALGHVRHTEVLSAGGLESYAECHMKWLVERELRPKRLEPDPEPLVRGSWVHDVLERVLSRLGGPVTPESLPRALEVLGETMAEISPRLAAGRPGALRRAVAETILADLRRYLERESACGSGWPPQALELRFGFSEQDPGSLPALVVERGGDRIALRGAIDRVDVEPDGQRAIVRDYKTGAARSEHQGSRWRTDQRLQVALYMVAVRDLLGLDPVAGLYQPLVGRDLRPRGIFVEGEPVDCDLVAGDGRDAEGLAEELEHACRRAVTLAAALRAGDLEPCPETCSREGCRYPGICRID